jgi:hypothetical protein
MRRRLGFLLMCSATIPVAIFAATAWGGGALTTLKASDSVAAPNQSVTFTGRNFSTNASFSNVQIRWNGRTGKVLTEVTPAQIAAGVPVAIPASASPGWYVVAATQYNTATGAPKSGSPARTTVRVQGGSAGSAAPWGAAKPTGSGGSGSPDLPLPGILLSVALLAAGMTLVARDRGKKVTRPVLGA